MPAEPGLTEVEDGGASLPGWRDSPVTVAIVVSCTLVFLASWTHCVAVHPDGWWRTVYRMDACPSSLDAAGGLWLGRVWVDGQWWRFVTAGFAHGSWIHWALNMWSLVVVGPWAERTWGRWRTGALFLLSSVGGCLASAGWVEAPLVVGASAGILGIAGAIWVARAWGRGESLSRLEPVSVRGLGVMLALMVGLGFAVPVVAQAGHLGGLAVGSALGLGWSRETRRSAVVGALASLFLLAAGIAAAAHPQWRPDYAATKGYFLLERGAVSEAIPLLEAAMAAQPEDVGAKNAVAYAFAEAGVELERGLELVLEALAAEPGNPDFLDTLGWLKCRGGDTEGGVTDIARADALTEGGEPEIHGHLERCAGASLR